MKTEKKANWNELAFTYMQAERAVLTIQQNFRAKRETCEKDVDKTNKSSYCTAEEEEDNSENSNRGLEEDFCTRIFEAIFGLIQTIALVFMACYKKLFRRDDDLPVVDATSTNAGSAPTP